LMQTFFTQITRDAICKQKLDQKVNANIRNRLFITFFDEINNLKMLSGPEKFRYD